MRALVARVADAERIEEQQGRRRGDVARTEAGPVLQAERPRSERQDVDVEEVVEERGLPEDEEWAGEGPGPRALDAEERGEKERHQAELEGDVGEARRVLAHVEPLDEGVALARKEHVAVAVQAAHRHEDDEGADACLEEEAWRGRRPSALEPPTKAPAEEHHREPGKERVGDDEAAEAPAGQEECHGERGLAAAQGERETGEGLAADDEDEGQCEEPSHNEVAERGHRGEAAADRIEHLEEDASGDEDPGHPEGVERGDEGPARHEEAVDRPSRAPPPARGDSRRRSRATRRGRRTSARRGASPSG